MCYKEQLAEIATVLAGNSESVEYDCEQDSFVYKNEHGDIAPFDLEEALTYLRMRITQMSGYANSLRFWSDYYRCRIGEAESFLKG